MIEQPILPGSLRGMVSTVAGQIKASGTRTRRRRRTGLFICSSNRRLRLRLRRPRPGSPDLTFKNRERARASRAPPTRALYCGPALFRSLMPRMSNPVYDVLVIGSGAAGLTTALRLSYDIPRSSRGIRTSRAFARTLPLSRAQYATMSLSSSASDC